MCLKDHDIVSGRSRKIVVYGQIHVKGEKHGDGRQEVPNVVSVIELE